MFGEPKKGRGRGGKKGKYLFLTISSLPSTSRTGENTKNWKEEVKKREKKEGGRSFFSSSLLHLN